MESFEGLPFGKAGAEVLVVQVGRQNKVCREICRGQKWGSPTGRGFPYGAAGPVVGLLGVRLVSGSKGECSVVREARFSWDPRGSYASLKLAERCSAPLPCSPAQAAHETPFNPLMQNTYHEVAV